MAKSAIKQDESPVTLAVQRGSLPRVAVLTGGGDKPYALGLASALLARGVAFDFIGSDDVDGPELRNNSLVHFLNLRGNQDPKVSLVEKVVRVCRYYLRLLGYAWQSEAKIFHILWNNKLELFDRTLLLLYYRALGKRLVMTAHNVNAGRRDGNDTWVNRRSLKVQYGLVDHVFVHTSKMKDELRAEFNVPEDKISVIPFGINNTVPNTKLSPAEAKRRLGLPASDKALLFFGNITPYKGLEYLVEALGLLAQPDHRLIIAGRPKGCAAYWDDIQRRITDLGLSLQVISRIEYVPDEDTELYFKAADVLVLPYTHVFQSGVLFLAYNFGLPVIASDVGSLKDDIIEERTGFVFRPQEPEDLASKIAQYFAGDLYRRLEKHRQEIQSFAQERYSWTKVSEITTGVYGRLIVRN